MKNKISIQENGLVVQSDGSASTVSICSKIFPALSGGGPNLFQNVMGRAIDAHQFICGQNAHLRFESSQLCRSSQASSQLLGRMSISRGNIHRQPQGRTIMPAQRPLLQLNDE